MDDRPAPRVNVVHPFGPHSSARRCERRIADIHEGEKPKARHQQPGNNDTVRPNEPALVEGRLGEHGTRHGTHHTTPTHRGLIEHIEPRRVLHLIHQARPSRPFARAAAARKRGRTLAGPGGSRQAARVGCWSTAAGRRVVGVWRPRRHVHPSLHMLVSLQRMLALHMLALRERRRCGFCACRRTDRRGGLSRRLSGGRS